MAKEYNLKPTDGISDHWVTLEGFDVDRHDQRSASIRFRIFRKGGYEEIDVAHLSFDVVAQGDGVDGMIARAHDDLVDALRQMLYAADLMRRVYRGEADYPTPEDEEE